jgi:hypothetical protein
MRRAQPSEPHRHARIVGADEHHFLPSGIEHPQHQEEVRVGRLRGDPQFCGYGAGDFDIAFHRRRAEGEAVARRVIAQRRRAGEKFVLRVGAERQSVRI